MDLPAKSQRKGPGNSVVAIRRILIRAGLPPKGQNLNPVPVECLLVGLGRLRIIPKGCDR